VASNRGALVKTKESLEISSCVASIDSPLSNLLEKENIKFKFNGTINKSAFSGQK